MNLSKVRLAYSLYKMFIVKKKGVSSQLFVHLVKCTFCLKNIQFLGNNSALKTATEK